MDDDIYLALVGELSSKLEAAEAELSQIKAKRTIEQVRASMLEGYSNRVFWFVVWYCVAVGFILVGSSFHALTNVGLSDTILGIIAGSTAVSVIGLIGMVITGLFGASPRAVSGSTARRKNSDQKSSD